MIRYLLAIIVVALIYLPCYISNDLLIELTEEDGLYEYGGAILFLLTSIAFFVLTIRPKLYQGNNGHRYPQRKFFLFLAVLFFFAFGEEISWGQRILNFDTPQSLKEINMQDEFNLHNIDIFHGIDDEGEEKTGIRALFTLHKMFYFACLTCLLFIPILYNRNLKIKNFLNRICLPIPFVFLGWLFVFNWFYGHFLRLLNSNLDGHGIVEIKEAVIALILVILPLSFINFKSAKKNTS